MSSHTTCPLNPLCHFEDAFFQQDDDAVGTHGNVRFADDDDDRFNNHDDGEYFPEPRPSPSPDHSRQPSPSPTPSHQRQRGSPGPNRKSLAAHTPKHKRAARAAKDVWTFFEDKSENKRECLFCRRVHSTSLLVKCTQSISLW